MALDRYDRVVLTGFMGSGKSTLGALLAARIGWTFLDLDHEVERREALSVPQIFAARGEAAFREAETAALADLLGRSRIVLALGGGAPESAANRELLARSPRTAVVYLSADFPTLSARCRAQAARPGSTARPNFADQALAEARFIRRHPLYRELATYTFDTGTHEQQACVAEIAALLEH